MRALWIAAVLFLVPPVSARCGEALVPDEVGIFALRTFDDIAHLDRNWTGIGGRAGYQIVGPLVAEAEAWNASDGGRPGAAGGLLAAKLVAEGLVTGIYARAGVAHYRGRATLALGGGLELYVVKRVVLRGEGLILGRRGGDQDLAVSLGVGFRL